MELCKGYKDSQGQDYYLGDIVYNPSFGDYWVVQKHKQGEDTYCPYRLVQWNDEDNYYIDLDEPAGFVIVVHENDAGYDEFLSDFKKITKQIKEDEALLDKEINVPPLEKQE